MPHGSSPDDMQSAHFHRHLMRPRRNTQLQLHVGLVLTGKGLKASIDGQRQGTHLIDVADLFFAPLLADIGADQCSHRCPGRYAHLLHACAPVRSDHDDGRKERATQSQALTRKTCTDAAFYRFLSVSGLFTTCPGMSIERAKDATGTTRGCSDAPAPPRCRQLLRRLLQTCRLCSRTNMCPRTNICINTRRSGPQVASLFLRMISCAYDRAA